MSNDLYGISGRIKNHIAMEGIAVSPVGMVLVNYFSHMAKGFYDLSETLPEPYKSQLVKLVQNTETLPKTIIQVSTPKAGPKALIEQIEEDLSNLGSSLEEARSDCLGQYECLGGNDSYIASESTNQPTDKHFEIRTIVRTLKLYDCLIEREKRSNE